MHENQQVHWIAATTVGCVTGLDGLHTSTADEPWGGCSDCSESVCVCAHPKVAKKMNHVKFVIKLWEEKWNK